MPAVESNVPCALRCGGGFTETRSSGDLEETGAGVFSSRGRELSHIVRAAAYMVRDGA